MAKYRLTVTVKAPKGVGKEDLVDYSGVAFQYYKKWLDPESPLWYTEVTKVKVKRRKR